MIDFGTDLIVNACGEACGVPSIFEIRSTGMGTSSDA